MVIKRYILSFIKLLNEEPPYSDFFYEKFSEIWSNHENVHENDFSRYVIDYNAKITNMDKAVKYSLSEYSLKKYENTDDKEIRKIIK